MAMTIFLPICPIAFLTSQQMSSWNRLQRRLPLLPHQEAYTRVSHRFFRRIHHSLSPKQPLNVVCSKIHLWSEHDECRIRDVQTRCGVRRLVLSADRSEEHT